MPFFSRPLDYGCLDRFDNGMGRFALPLQYHRLFYFVLNLSRRLRARRLPAGEVMSELPAGVIPYVEAHTGPRRTPTYAPATGAACFGPASTAG